MINHDETQTLRIQILLIKESQAFNDFNEEVYEIEIQEAA